MNDSPFQKNLSRLSDMVNAVLEAEALLKDKGHESDEYQDAANWAASTINQVLLFCPGQLTGESQKILIENFEPQLETIYAMNLDNESLDEVAPLIKSWMEQSQAAHEAKVAEKE